MKVDALFTLLTYYFCIYYVHMYYLGPCMYCVVSFSVTNFGKKIWMIAANSLNFFSYGEQWTIYSATTFLERCRKVV